MSSWFEDMKPLFIARTAFGPWDGDRWSKYINWSGLTQLDELVSLDSMMCPLLLRETKDTYWPHIVNEDFMLDYFIDSEFLIEETADIERKNILCVFRNPACDPVVPIDKQPFKLLGYDLVDTCGSISALSNCGGFADVFANQELSRHGLILSRERAFEVQTLLRARHPDERHADCHVWALFRPEPEISVPIV